jgi:hypothetical protein
MSHCTVIWTTRSLGQLARIWTDHPAERQAVTQATALIDAELSRNPASKGTEEAEGLRRLRMPPLTVLYEVRELDRIVEIVAVKLIPTSVNGAAS